MALSVKKWSDIKKGKVRRKAYAKLLVRVLLHGDFGSVPFLVRRTVKGDK